MSPTAIVAYLALFATVGFLFVLASLILGWFLRASVPTPQKLEAYECGEPAIGSGSVQFDLRFYVVALLFLIFEVEVAFFFPPATVFGKAIRAEREAAVASRVVTPQGEMATKGAMDGKNAVADGSGLGGAVADGSWLNEASSRTLALISMIDLGVFFAVLLVGFAFVWKRGDLDWVRAVRHPATPGETAALLARLQRSEL
jgi:NADH-quinone oxidoreductase subunit A